MGYWQALAIGISVGVPVGLISTALQNPGSERVTILFCVACLLVGYAALYKALN